MGYQYGINLLSDLSVIVMLAAASVTDIRKGRIPDRLVLAGAFAGMVLLIAAPDRDLPNKLAGGAIVGSILLIVHLVTKGALGLGDVKLFGCTGFLLGVENAASALLSAVLLSGIYSLLLICINSNNKKREIPFAPFIFAGALTVIIF